jgi:hypothetical protein
MKREKAVIDGANVAYVEAPRERRPNLKHIFAVVEAVVASGREPIVVIDTTNHSLIPDASDFEGRLGHIKLISVPPGEDTGRVVLDTAAKQNAAIISNNTYADYFEEFPTIEQRRIPVALVDGTVLLLENRLKRAS